MAFLAFYSLNAQLPGLIGQNGILPVAQSLGTASVSGPWEGFWKYPTLAWWFSSDTALLAMTWSGMFLSVLLFFDVVPRAVLILLWFFYLSLFLAGQLFTSYQWDLLLTEVLFASIFFAPATVWPGEERNGPPRFARFLLTFVLFKLMFLGGLVKLLSGDPVWWNLTALEYHFWTQPIPAPLAWFAHRLPSFLLTIGVVFTFVVELILPFFLFMGRRLRTFAVLGIVGFQIVVAATGNYGVFNLLTVVLCLVVLDDSTLRTWIPINVSDFMNSEPEPRKKIKFRLGMEGLLVAALVLLNVFVLLESVGVPLNRAPIKSIRSWSAPFRSVNTYGLFAKMTTKRREIVIQGSNDGLSWKNYRFLYKPGDPQDAPPMVAPHMPRLDWQMWFAALKPPNRVQWFPHFLRRLLEGSQPVHDLLLRNPFPDDPPRYVRAITYEYEFTDWGEWWKEGRWWVRTNRELYYPPLTLQNGKLQRVQRRE